MNLSSNCTASQIKANSGRNTFLKLYSGIGAMLSSDNKNLNEVINFKAFYANPVKYYYETLALKRINLLS